MKVLDFGIAKARDNALRTQAGQIKGKLGYVAPRPSWASPSTRVPIFLPSAPRFILFLCGRPAFSGNTPIEVFEKSLQPPVAPSVINPQVPRSLEKICLTCLQKDRNKRYKDAANSAKPSKRHLAAAQRPLGPPQLAQFMKILFPPDKDPERQRKEALIATAPEQPSEAPADRAPVPVTPPSAEQLKTQEIRSAPLSVELPSDVDAPKGAYHLRSVEVQSEIEAERARKKRGRQRAEPAKKTTPKRTRRAGGGG